MMSANAGALANEPLIPNCCNIGVVFRVLSVVTGVVFLGLWSRGDALYALIEDFSEACILIEPIVLLSMVSLCVFRRYAYQHVMASWLQRMLCAGLPVLITVLVVKALSSMDWFAVVFPEMNMFFLCVFASLSGIVFQQYFEMRARLFSPALDEARLQALQARIRPHFLFNSLNTALSFVRSEPRRAEMVLEDLSDLFRALMSDTRQLTSLAAEIQLCRQYLEIEALRLGERLQVSWNLHGLSEAEMQTIQIPSLLLQPLMENAVHYGIEPSMLPAVIDISVKRHLDKIEIRMRNPLHPRARIPAGNQIALENIRQRLMLLYDVEAKLSCKEDAGHFEVNLYFPPTR